MTDHLREIETMTIETDEPTSQRLKIAATRRGDMSCAARERAPAFRLMPGPLVYVSLATRRTFD